MKGFGGRVRLGVVLSALGGGKVGAAVGFRFWGWMRRADVRWRLHASSKMARLGSNIVGDGLCD
jgi:hypothetical protein